MQRTLISIAAVALIAACASTPGEEEVSKYGPAPLISNKGDKQDSTIDVLALLGLAYKKGDSSNPYIKQLDSALAKVTQDQASNTVQRRNLILDRMIHASNDLCEDYKTTLKSKQSNANFIYGASTLALGSLGGAVSGANAARNLSSLSSISSGLRAEHNQSFYSDQSAQVIVKAIELRRSSMLEALAVARRCNIDAYSIPMAMADAVKYHGACTLVGGLSQIDNALSMSASSNSKSGTEALASNAFFQDYLATASRTFTVTTVVTSTPSMPRFGSLTASLSPLEYCKETGGSGAKQ